MEEIKTNIHIHTRYSDGSKNHTEIMRDAVQSGLDAIIFTDHNVYLEGIEGYHQFEGRKIMVIMGQEIHDPNATPQKNHLLSLGGEKDLSHFADNRNKLIREIHTQEGAAFLAHPYDPALPGFNEPDISWEDWTVKDFDGIELWNGFSELKVRVRTKIAPYFYAFFPKYLPVSPPEQTVNIWDDMHRKGKHVSAIAGSDAHAITFSAGPLKRVIFPYQYHFSAINNHLKIKGGLNGDFEEDKKRLISALIKGRNFLANGLIADAAGFQFEIRVNSRKQLEMGDAENFSEDLLAHVQLPKKAMVRLMKDGQSIKLANGVKTLDFPISSRGVYRVEVYRKSRGIMRAWIFSNPIYIE